MPRALIFAPQRRSMVSSTPTTTGPVGTKAATSSSNSRCARGARGRASQAEDAVIDGEARRLVQAHDAQRRGDRAPPRDEQGPSHQH